MSMKRLVLSNVNIVDTQNNEVEVEVVLSYKESIVSSKIVSSNEQHHKLRAVAQASLQALNEFLQKLNSDQVVIFKLVDFRTVVLANINQVIFLVVIEIIELDEKSFVSGSSIARIEALHIEQEARFSVARAVLNATNRKATRYI